MADTVFEYKENRKKEQLDKAKKKAAKKGDSSQILLSNLVPDIDFQAENVEKAANNIGQQAQQKSNLTPTDPIQNLVNQIMGQYNSISSPATPYEELKRIAESQVGAQFDPMMNLLQQQMNQRGKNANRSSGEARQMYNALGQDFLSQLPELTQQFAAEDRETNARYDGAQQQLQQRYQNQQQEQNAVLQQLGIQAAAPDASKQAMEDQNYFQGQMETDQQSALNALNQQQQAQSDYTRNLGNTSRMAGENTAQDIMRQLSDYMDQANTQMSGLQSQRGAALSSLLQQMQGQDAARVEKDQQQQFQNLMSLANFQLDAAKAQGKNSGASNSIFGGTTGLTGAQNFLAEQYPNSPVMASNLMEQLNDVLSNKDVVAGKFQLEPGDPSKGVAPKYSDVGQEYMVDLLRREIEKENQAQPGRYGTADVNNTINALLAYLGKLR